MKHACWFLLLAAGGVSSAALAQDGDAKPPAAKAPAAPTPAKAPAAAARAPAAPAPAKAPAPKAVAPAPVKAPVAPVAPKAVAPAAETAGEAKTEAAPAAKLAADCPPGAYCEAAEVEPPPTKAAPAEAPAAEAPAAAPGTTITLPPAPPGSENKPRVVVVRRGKNGQPDQVIIYENGDAPPHLPPGYLPPAPAAPPPYAEPWRRRHHPVRRSGHRRWGLGLRAEGAIMSQQHEGVRSYGMGGLGFSLRYRPVPAFAFDLGTDILAGKDTNGLSRQELPVSLNLMLYLNPRSIAQFYLMGGANLSFARVYSDTPLPNLAGGNYDKYTYGGGQLGAGFEFRLSPLIGIHVDGLAFFRTRLDSDGQGRYPEFYQYDATNRTATVSNSSAGGLLRAGLNFWW